MTFMKLGEDDSVKKILIQKVDNGYVITVSTEGVQSLFDSEKSFVANDVDEVLKIVKENA